MDARRVYETTFAVNYPTEPCHATETRDEDWQVSLHAQHPSVRVLSSPFVYQCAGIKPTISDFVRLVVERACACLTCGNVSGRLCLGVSKTEAGVPAGVRPAAQK